MKKINLRKTKTIIVIVTSAAIVLSASSNYGSTSAFFPREQHNDIFIYSDSLFTFENGVRSGNGTQNNPYMISTWDVDEIKIINTSKNFKIWNCEIDKVIIKDVEDNTCIIDSCDIVGYTPGGWLGGEMQLSNSNYSLVINCNFTDNYISIWVDTEEGVVIQDCYFQDTVYCSVVFMRTCGSLSGSEQPYNNHHLVEGCTFKDVETGVRFKQGVRNTTVKNCIFDGYRYHAGLHYWYSINFQHGPFPCDWEKDIRDNIITGNRFTNVYYGISFNMVSGEPLFNMGNVSAFCNDNLFYNNYFKNNHRNLVDGWHNPSQGYYNDIIERQQWSIEKTPGTNIIGGNYLAGNYWDDYYGWDLPIRDGIGDTALPYRGWAKAWEQSIPSDTQPLVIPGESIAVKFFVLRQIMDFVVFWNLRK